MSHFEGRLNSSDIYNHTLYRCYVLLTQYGLGDQTEMHEVGGACYTYGGESKVVYSVLLGKHERKRPLGKHRHRWKGNITMDIPEGGCEALTRSMWLSAGTGGEHL